MLNISLGDSISLSQLSQRQEVDSELIYSLLSHSLQSQVSNEELKTVLADILYQGYIISHNNASERINHHDNLKVPPNFKFEQVSSLSNEMVERLQRANPQTFGHVRKIPGLTPAAISTVLIYLSASKHN